MGKSFKKGNIHQIREFLWKPGLDPAEIELWEALENTVLDETDYYEYLKACGSLSILINKFFEDCLVDSPDPRVKDNRQLLLGICNKFFADLAPDLSCLR